MAFWSPSTGNLIAFRYDGAGNIDGVYYWTVFSLPSQGTVFSNPGTPFISDVNQIASAEGSSVYGGRVPNGGYTDVGFSGSKYLSIVPSSNEYGGFGGSATDWSYGFVLTDDWVAGSSANMLLSPVIGERFFVSAIQAYGDGVPTTQGFLYGDDDDGPFVQINNEAGWDISTTDWKIAAAGSLVVVTYDGTTTPTFDRRVRIYVDGNLILSANAINDYMAANPVVSELRFGDVGGYAMTQYPTGTGDATTLGGWYARMDALFIANGTTFDASQVAELGDHTTDFTQSDNYGDFTSYATFDAVGITPVLGTTDYSRGNVEF